MVLSSKPIITIATTTTTIKIYKREYKSENICSFFLLLPFNVIILLWNETALEQWCNLFFSCFSLIFVSHIISSGETLKITENIICYKIIMYTWIIYEYMYVYGWFGIRNGLTVHNMMHVNCIVSFLFAVVYFLYMSNRIMIDELNKSNV